ncbi:MAG: hypothetical protein LBK45_00610, partial [Tannerellaceae bacterium]|nr:hypothetical protein [Tannerellaceae bacterium]
MATIYLSLSAKSDTNPQREIRIRFKHGKIDQQAKSGIFIPAENWNQEKKQIIIPNIRVRTNEKTELKQYLTEQSEKLNTLLSVINTIFNVMDKSNIACDWLKDCVDQYYERGKYAPVDEESKRSFFDSFDEYLKKRKLSEVREKNYMVLKRALQRYELFISLSEKRA